MFQTHHIITVPPTVQRKGRKRRENSKTPGNQVQRVWPIAVLSTAGLAQHPVWRNWPQSRATPDWTSLQDISSLCRFPVTAPLLQQSRRHALLLVISSPSSTAIIGMPNPHCIQLNLEKLCAWGYPVRKPGPLAPAQAKLICEVGETVYRCNRRQLIQANKPEPLKLSSDTPHPTGASQTAALRSTKYLKIYN